MPCATVRGGVADNSVPSDDAEKDFFNLTHEIVRLLRDDELFTYAIYPEVEGTNNESERTLRNPARARLTGQTNKTARGASRRTVLTSVLDSLRLYVPKMNLQGVLTEISGWQAHGKSCFGRMADSQKIAPRSPTENVPSRLERLVPLVNTG